MSPFFLSLWKILQMNKLYYILFLSVFLFGCPAEETDPPIVYEEDYGEGVYILTTNGVSFYDLGKLDSFPLIKKDDTLIENIFTKVNGESLYEARSIEINNKDLYIVTKNALYRVDIETFQKELKVDGFTNAQNCKYVKFERVYVSDLDDSEIKVVDLTSQSITTYIETGNSSKPSYIALNWRRAFVMN